jgi:hypothetical protein
VRTHAAGRFPAGAFLSADAADLRSGRGRFLLIRRRTDKISPSPLDWAIAMGGTLAPVLVVDPETVFLSRLGVVLMLIGFVFHFCAKLALRLSFGIVPADRGLKSLGLYAFIRQPIYLDT